MSYGEKEMGKCVVEEGLRWYLDKIKLYMDGNYEGVEIEGFVKIISF